MKIPFRIISVTSLLGLIPTLANACSVCFSGGSADTVRGFFWGVVVLLVLPFATFSVIVFKIVRASRKDPRLS
jgi:hypothetical protein